MPPFTERDAEKLSPEQATALLRILDLQASWNALVSDKVETELNARRKAYEAFRTALNRYTEKHGEINVPEPTQTMPDRLASWCRILRIVLTRSEGVRAPHLMAKVSRLTERIAAKMGKEPVGRDENLDTVIAWCETMVVPAPILKKRSA